MVWVHPYQARVSMIDDTAKQLTQVVSTGPDWPYALVWLNGDTHHVPLPTDGHLSIMMEGNTSNVHCGKICQLEVCQLLGSGSWMVDLEGLNRCQVPVVMSLLESLSNGMTMLKGESTFLQVHLSQPATKEQESKAPSLGGVLSPTPAASPTRVLPPKRKANQHDHGGQQTPILGTSGHFWSSIQKYHTKKTRIPGLGHTTTS